MFSPRVLLGLARLTLLKRLKKSACKRSLTFSVIGNRLMTEKSKFL